MRVSLMLTCLCDAFYGEVGIAAVRVLEHAGCNVEFEDQQTCCGQPPFNAGDWEAARKIGEHALNVFDPPSSRKGEYLVTPSASCAAMMRHGYGMLWPDRGVPYCFEMGEFLVEVVGLEHLSFKRGAAKRIALHNACHGRMLHAPTPSYAQALLSLVPGLDLVEFEQSDQCCGFGGAFSATHGHVSSGIGLEKLRNVAATGVEELVSGDMGCLMHLDGLIKRHEIKLRIRHYIELLADSLNSEPPLPDERRGEGAGGEGSGVVEEAK